MNPRLASLQPYPFEKLRALTAGVTGNPAKRAISLSIGEPRHPTPQLLIDALVAGTGTLAHYPTTIGMPALREAIAGWLARRHVLPALDPLTQVLPVLGSREALFAFAQVVVDGSRDGATVVVPNPFYQIYEGAALLAGAAVHCVNSDPIQGFRHDWAGVPDEVWSRTQLLYLCSPDNPTGRVAELDEWQALFALADRHGFVIASDECYSEIYANEDLPPPGLLQASARRGRPRFERCVVFHSLSKRSNLPGLRSGFVAGDPALMTRYRLYRTYHGSAMPEHVQQASIAAWSDEAHVLANRNLYRAKYEAVMPLLADVLDVERPAASFYLWPGTPTDDEAFARDLLAATNVSVLPGSYLGRDVGDGNPGLNRLRISLVAGVDECVEAARRIRHFIEDR